MKKYGLRNKKSKKIVGYIISSTDDGVEGVSEIHTLSDEDENMWLVDDPKHAEWVRLNSTAWFNALYDTPDHKFEADDYEVVEVVIIQTVKPVKVKIPTQLEMLELKYSKKEPAHFKHLKKLINKGEEVYGTLWDYKEVW